jgi:hypothetical protein
MLSFNIISLSLNMPHRWQLGECGKLGVVFMYAKLC